MRAYSVEKPLMKAAYERPNISRRQVLGGAAKIAAGLALARTGLARAVTDRGAFVLGPSRRRVLDAALARMIPASGPGDWSAADLGTGEYIERLLAGDGVYAGGPYRRNFGRFQRLSRIKRVGWNSETRRLRRLYRKGLAELDRRAGGDFAARPAPAQDAILESLDYEGHPFFAALYNHTMEGVYSHPAYGGNKGYRAWKDLCYEGDVHGIRFPTKGSPGPWDVYGGYSPEEMARPGVCPEPNR